MQLLEASGWQSCVPCDELLHAEVETIPSTKRRRKDNFTTFAVRDPIAHSALIDTSRCKGLNERDIIEEGIGGSLRALACVRVYIGTRVRRR